MPSKAIEARNILVTGGAGFVGSHLIERLHADNNVIVVDNLRYGDRDNLAGFDHVLIEENIATADLAAVMGDHRIDLVFHLASHHLGDSLQDPMTDFTTSALGGLRVLEACRQTGVKRVVYTSTGSIYGEPEGAGHDETHRILPNVPYGVSKAATDHYARIYCSLYGLETVRMRYYNIYGPRRTAGAIPQFVLTALEGGTIRIEGGEQVRTPTYVTDTVEATIRGAAVENAAGKAFNVAASGAVSVMEMAKLIVRLCDAEDRVTFEETGYRPGEIMQLRPDVSLARDVLGWQAEVGLEDGFRQLIEYLRSA